MLVSSYTYAGDLNRLIVRMGKVWKATNFRVPYCTSVRQVRDTYFKPIDKPFRVASIYVNVPAPNECLSRSYHGRVNSYEDVKRFIRDAKERHNLPGTTISVYTRLVG